LPQLAGSLAVRTQFEPHKVDPAAHVPDWPPESPGAVASCVAVVDASTTPPELDELPPEDDELPEGIPVPSPPFAAMPLAQSTDNTQVAMAAAKTANPRTNRRTEVRSMVLTFISYFTLPKGSPTITVAKPSFVGSRSVRWRTRLTVSVTGQTNRSR
jgi:hypothetical protein